MNDTVKHKQDYITAFIEGYICAITGGRMTTAGARGADTVLKTKLFGRKVRHFNNSYMLITFTRSTQTLFTCKLQQGSAVM